VSEEEEVLVLLAALAGTPKNWVESYRAGNKQIARDVLALSICECGNCLPQKPQFRTFLQFVEKYEAMKGDPDALA